MDELWRVLRNPRVATPLILAGTVVVGFVAILFAGMSASRFQAVPLQVPQLVSGGVAGLALVGTSLGLLTIHRDRVESAQERARLAELQRDALRLLRQRRGGE